MLHHLLPYNRQGWRTIKQFHLVSQPWPTTNPGPSSLRVKSGLNNQTTSSGSGSPTAKNGLNSTTTSPGPGSPMAKNGLNNTTTSPGPGSPRVKHVLKGTITSPGPCSPKVKSGLNNTTTNSRPNSTSLQIIYNSNGNKNIRRVLTGEQQWMMCSRKKLNLLPQTSISMWTKIP